MAGSRLEKLGTIFKRVTGLLRSGAMKEDDKPIWYDVYKAFPPKYEPSYSRPVEFKEINPILYQEDVIRARYYKKYGNVFGLVDMLNPKSVPTSQRFIEKYQELQGKGIEGDLFKATEDILRNEGLLTHPDNKDDQLKSEIDKPIERLNTKISVSDILKD